MTARVMATSSGPAKKPASTSAESRLYYLDWLRVIIIGMVFVGHTMMPFTGAPWLITANQIAPLSGLIALVGNQFAMPVMFLISGAGAYFSLRKRAPGRFARERLMRLGLPFVVFTVLLSPIQAYYSALDKGTYSGPFFPDFLPHFFNLDGFGGRDLSFLGYYGYHLWFLGFLLFFSLAALPVIGCLKGPAGQRLTDRVARVAERPGGLLLVFLPFALLQLVMTWFWHGYQGWANTTFWGAFFLLGYLFYSDARFAAAIRRDRKIWVWAAVVTVLILAGLALLGLLGLSNLLDAAQADPDAVQRILAAPGDAIQKAGLVAPLLLGYVGVLTAYNYNAWALALLVIAVAIGRLNYTDRKLQVASPFSMPFYIFHHPFVVVFGYYIVRLTIGAIPEMVLLGASALIASIAIVAFLIAPWNPARVVFGLRKPAPRPAKAPARTAGDA
ncbi:MAG: acyltransferase family protein [Nitrososphaerales archaeon]